MISTACPDWQDRIVNRQSLVPFEIPFPDEAEAALAVFKSLRMVDVAGKPTFGECCDEWVFDFVKAIFGTYDSENSQRLIREFFLLISKKNGKSTIAAAVMLTALIRNWRHSAILLILAPTIEIAQNSFEPARDMVRADPELSNLLHIQENLRKITNLVTKATLRIIAANADTVGGVKASFVLVDELWLLGKRPNAEAMLQEATGGLISRPEGFVIYLSTQSDAPPAGVFKSKLDYFRDIRDGSIIDPKSFGMLYEFPPEMVKTKAYLDPANWYVTNPNIGRSVDPDFIATKIAEAERGDGDSLQTLLSKHLNIEIGANLRANRWPGTEFWAQNAIKLTLGELLDRSEVVVVGIDGGGADDLLGLCVLGREKVSKGDKEWLCWSHAWAHKSVLERRKSIASVLRDFENAGDLTIVKDELGDIADIADKVSTIKDRGLLAAVAIDPAGVGEIVDVLAEIGVTQEAENLIGVPQGWQMMNSIKTAERRLIKGTLKHADSAMMTWCVTNLKIEATATSIRATKQNAGDAKIDPAMAMFNAVAVMSRNPVAQEAPKFQMLILG